MTRDVVLPPAFETLRPFARKWALRTNAERKAMRLASTKEEINAFYEAIAPQLDAALTYLNGFPLSQIPPEAESLFDMALSAAEIGIYVEWFGGEPVPPTARGLADRVQMIYEPTR